MVLGTWSFKKMPKDEFDFEDPMELNGVGIASIEDTTEAMTECFIEEFMRLGYNAKQIYALFRNPHYLGMNMVVQNRGEQFVRERIAEMFARWGRPVTWPDSTASPLTPALSPGERETCRQSVDLSSAKGNSSERTLLSPFPAGEGRGENSPNRSSRFEPLNRAAPPLPSLSPAQSGGEGGVSPGEGEVHGEGEVNSTEHADFHREQMTAHDATGTDPTGAPIPILKQ